MIILTAFALSGCEGRPSLGLTFAAGSSLPAPFTSGAFVGQHGARNRRTKSGYKVISVPFQNGKPPGEPIDVLTGFLSPDEKALGRPVGVAIDKQGALLVADDAGNTVWRVRVAENMRNAQARLPGLEPCRRRWAG